MIFKKYFSVFLAVLFLSACGGGGSGGGSISLPSNGGPNPTDGGGGTSGGGNGSASYYGFNSANSIVSNALPPFVSGEQFVVANELAIIVSDLDNRVVDYMIHEPICLAGLLTYDYNAVLVKGDPTAPSRIRISAGSSSVMITEYTELQSGAGYVDKTTETNSGTCSNGEFFRPSVNGSFFKMADQFFLKIWIIIFISVLEISSSINPNFYRSSTRFITSLTMEPWTLRTSSTLGTLSLLAL